MNYSKLKASEIKKIYDERNSLKYENERLKTDISKFYDDKGIKLKTTHNIERSTNYSIEIVHWQTQDKRNIWNVYVYINERSPLFKLGINVLDSCNVSCDLYYKEHIISKMYDHKVEYYKIGNDYNHEWNDYENSCDNIKYIPSMLNDINAVKIFLNDLLLPQ